MYDKYVHIYVHIYRTDRMEKGNADEIRIITGSQSRRPMERLDVERGPDIDYDLLWMYTARTAPNAMMG
jgi:hypothetical protein